MGQYEQALPLFQQALEIIGKILGTEHPGYAESLNLLNGLYELMGQNGKAKYSNMNQAIINQIQKYNQTLEMLYQQGQYDQGIIFAQQTCDLAKSYSLTNEPIYADSLNNLALLYESMGQYEQALPLHQQALEIRGKSLGLTTLTMLVL